MAEIVNPIPSPPPPSSTTTPSQPLQIPQISSPAPPTAISSIPPPPPPPSLPSTSASASATMPSLLPPQPAQPQSQTQPQPSMPPTTYPARAPPGAPGRNYLNTHLAPYLRTGMNSILDAKPPSPLRWLGEYLIAQSLIHEGGTDDNGMVDRFTYPEHGRQVEKMRPESLMAVRGGRGEEREMEMTDSEERGRVVNGVHTGEGEEEVVEEEMKGGKDTEMEMGGG